MNTTLKCALIQSDLHWEDPEQNRNKLADTIQAIHSQTDLIILPEMFTTGFTMTPDHIAVESGEETIEWMKQMSSDMRAAITGSIVFKEGSSYYNRLAFVQPNGIVSYYNKRHTFTLAGEHEVYTAGNQVLVIEYMGFKICPMICYDLRFPVWSRNTKDYDLLLYVANWPKPRIAAWDTLLKARAIENMAYCIGVNRVGKDENNNEYSGHSAVYDGLGAEVVFSDKETVLYATLEKQHIQAIRNKLKFLDDRDTFTVQF